MSSRRSSSSSGGSSRDGQGEAERRSEEVREVRRSGCNEVGGPSSARGQAKGGQLGSWADPAWDDSRGGIIKAKAKGQRETSRRIKTS